jgi:hypothetical protein
MKFQTSERERRESYAKNAKENQNKTKFWYFFFASFA